MVVYKFDYKCGLCNETSTAYTYIHYMRYYEDLRFPYEDWMMNDVYAAIHEDNVYFDTSVEIPDYPVKILGDDPALDEEIVRLGKFPSIRKRKSLFRAEPYYANCCQNPTCKGMYGNDYLRKYIVLHHLKNNTEMQIECEI